MLSSSRTKLFQKLALSLSDLSKCTRCVYDWYIIPCRSVYQILSFVFFFFNVIYGIVMCFLRVFGMLVFTIIMLFRMDRDVYMRGLEGWDVGTWASVRLTVHRNTSF